MTCNAHPQSSECDTFSDIDIDSNGNMGTFSDNDFDWYEALETIVVESEQAALAKGGEDGFDSPQMAFDDAPVAKRNYELLVTNTTPACSFLFSALSGSILAERRDYGALEGLTSCFANGGASCTLSSQTTDIRYNCDERDWFGSMHTVFNRYSIESLGELYTDKGDTVHVLTFPYWVRLFGRFW